MLKILCSMIFVLLFVSSNTYGKEKLNVVTSIAPLAYFIENIGGDRVNVTTLIPPAGNPHTYEPTPRQMNTLSKADLYVKVGSGIEFELVWMKRIKDINKNMPVCDASGGITLIDANDHEHAKDHINENGHSHHGAKDPHIWLSPVNAIVITQNIRDSLSEADPEDSDFYHTNASELIDKLNNLKQKIMATLGGISKRKFYIFHPAWGYFARDFDLEQIPVELSGKEPTPGRLEALVKRAMNEKIDVIFSSPQSSSKSAEVIAREIKGKVVFIDPMSDDYLNNLENTTRLLQENLK
ncbi:MAG: zinc ABC transporter substrate-binding protein [Deltaproteobacteria bacterium]|nr:zinc ABC transporter substrate-binding protein [Deltaproteobacteria bacterium]